MIDIVCGNQYINFFKELPDEDKSLYATLIFNSDGSPAFESSTFSIVPIQLCINEIPFEERYRNTIICGYWFGKDKPNMSIFVKAFVDSMNDLSVNGVVCKIAGEQKVIKIFPLCCCVGAIARAPMFCQKQFNGEMGCSWCLYPGEPVFHKTKFVQKYPLLSEIFPRRNEINSRDQMSQAINSDKPVQGYKSRTPLADLKKFKVIDGNVTDPMHIINLGVSKQFANYWFTTKGKNYSLNDDEIEIIDAAMGGSTVPTKLQWLCRSIKDRSRWKSKEWHNWLLYYSVPTLTLIPRLQEYVMH